MIIDGEKYACEACVRGHRVSNCQHSDRPLQHINKKGRPVSQCQHCRAMRKSRAAHIKCDCGEKTSKCAHLQPTVDGHKETCCCNHGGRCSCGGKKEPTLDTVPESDSEGEARSASSGSARPKAPPRRRRANTVHSDGVLSFDQNGHHKPTTKHSRVSQKCGPYQLNRVNSANSTSSLGAGTESPREGHGGRSRAGSSREQRRVKSEAASPLMSGSGFPNLNGNLPPLDLSGIEYPPYVNNNSFDLFSSGLPDGIQDHDAPIYSAGLSAASVDWSHYDLGEMKGDSFTPSSYSQAGAQSFNGMFDFGSGSEQLPTLANTTSTSGEVSEVEDFMPGGDGDLDGFGLRQNNMLGDVSSIDYDSFYKGADPMAGSGISMVEEDPAFWMPNYNDGIAAVDESPDPLGPASMGSFWEM
ncbi:Copper resistance protein CRF1 [Paramyrothecium foliicola]|nr:Copper resistance protein CRF1 [Paramyrothecium foliicola]